ncbi:DUF6992 family protein [Sandaracinus amylolyticus]|uniref:DUF6992 family protein n=1 Tax=Sandaracinus amylolyticus TaxID=927083 RepID=UPI001F1AF3A5|nr:hypothetical protein [Sandaracinus amylolyticus]UJR78652.1 Hypothetical protein I5071_6830 [Sandaracinus amylolyticus]
MRAHALALVALLVVALPGTASAQVLAREDRAVERLATLRLSHRSERIDEGLVLLTFGLASVVLGGVAAGVGHDDPWWLGAGLGTVGWGAVNAAFSLGMLDLGGGLARSSDDDRLLRGATREERTRALARDQYASATVLAVNAGLDVFYITTGVLLAVIANLLDTREPALEGYGVAMAAQGLGLLAFDLTVWVRSMERGDDLLALE